MPLYKLSRTLFALGDEFRIRDENDRIVFTVRQTFLKAMLGEGISMLVKGRTRFLPGIDGAGFSKLEFLDADGIRQHIIVRHNFARLRPTFDFKHNGKVFGTLKEKYRARWRTICSCCCTSGREFVFTFDNPNESPIYIRGGVMELTLDRDGVEIGNVSKQFFSMSDGYGLQTKPNQDDELLLAICITIGTLFTYTD